MSALAQYEQILSEIREQNRTYGAIAARYGITRVCVSRIADENGEPPRRRRVFAKPRFIHVWLSVRKGTPRGCVCLPIDQWLYDALERWANDRQIALSAAVREMVWAAVLKDQQPGSVAGENGDCTRLITLLDEWLSKRHLKRAHGLRKIITEHVGKGVDDAESG